jgi:hypothetical protein
MKTGNFDQCGKKRVMPTPGTGAEWRGIWQGADFSDFCAHRVSIFRDSVAQCYVQEILVKSHNTTNFLAKTCHDLHFGGSKKPAQTPDATIPLIKWQTRLGRLIFYR